MRKTKTAIRNKTRPEKERVCGRPIRGRQMEIACRNCAGQHFHAKPDDNGVGDTNCFEEAFTYTTVITVPGRKRPLPKDKAPEEKR